MLEVRSSILQAIRSFFLGKDFYEVETPVRIPVPALELHIDAEPSGYAFLRTSPEFHMKRLLSEGASRIFQVGPCFRRGEKGNYHGPEFTMLEWYRAGSCYTDILRDIEGLILSVAENLKQGYSFTYRGSRIDVSLPWERVRVDEAFMNHAGWNPFIERDDNRFDRDMVEKVEPSFFREKPVILTDYPPYAAGLGRISKKDGFLFAERWELYIGGLELANACTELTDAAEHRNRFSEWAEKRRIAGSEVYPVDEAFMQTLETGLPECAGAAAGVDRLAMLFCDAASIDDVRAF